MTFVAGCELKTDEPNFSTDKPIQLSVSTFLNNPDATRFVFNPDDSTKMMWEGNETLGVMIGNTGSKTGDAATYSTQPLATVNGRKGVFEGDVTLGSWTTEDIRGIVCPCTEHAWIRYNSDFRIVCRVGSEKQVQAHNNVLNCRYAPVFAEITLADFNVNGNTYSIEDKQLRWACSMFRYNIYGKHPQMNNDEIFKSITITCVSSWHLAGTYEWKIGQGKAVYNGIASFIETELTEECTIADKTQENGIKVFGVLLPRNTTFIGLKVVTDKATYNKTINYTSTALSTPGTVLPVNIDLSTFTSRVASSAEPYSIDGGNTWSSSLPTASDNFTSFIAKGAELTSADLTAIFDAVKAQAAPVDIDLSQSTYATGIFPAVVGATEGAKNTTIKSIKFPSNIISIAESAFRYCDALESVDLTGIQEIGANAFGYCHLKTVSIPNTVTTIGNQAFRWNFYLDSAYFNAPKVAGTYILAQNDATQDSNPESKKEVIVIGPDVQEVPQYFCRSNALLNKVIFEGNAKMNLQMFSNSKWLETIVFKSTTPPVMVTEGNLCSNANTGSQISAENKKIIVPAGCKAAFEASAPSTELVGRGYTVVEAD